MKTIFYTLVMLFMGATFTSCTADNISDNVDASVEEVATNGEHGHVEDEDEGGN